MSPPVPPRTGLLVTCPMDLCQPALGFTAVERLRAAGCTVEVPAQGCCGRTALEKGDRRGAAALARSMIGTFQDYDQVVGPHRACAAMIRDHYPALLADDPAWAARARNLADRCTDLTGFLSDAGDAANAVRDRTLAHLDHYLNMFEAQVKASDGHVHWAGDAEDALAIIRQLCLNHGVGPVIHDGSPLTVEIGLEAALTRAGINGADTDAPALIGVTGARFLVAETGSAVIVKAMDGASPANTRCHIVLAGIDRIVPTLGDADLPLRLLRACPGIPARVLFATGPRQPDDADGPDAFHIILLDNGRTSLLAASVAPAPTMARRAGWLWTQIARRPHLYRRITSFLCHLRGHGSSFQVRWQEDEHG